MDICALFFFRMCNKQCCIISFQLNECHERMAGLEQSLDQVENQKDDVAKEKNKWLWEYQKRQKVGLMPGLRGGGRSD